MTNKIPFTQPLAVHVRKSILDDVISRGASSVSLNRDLERLYALYARAIRETPLELNEALLIVNALNGTIMEANTAPFLFAKIEDEINFNGLAEKWEINGPALVEALKGLTQLQALALVDAAERFWNIPEDKRDILADVKVLFNIRK